MRSLCLVLRRVWGEGFGRGGFLRGLLDGNSCEGRRRRLIRAFGGLGFALVVGGPLLAAGLQFRNYGSGPHFDIPQMDIFNGGDVTRVSMLAEGFGVVAEGEDPVLQGIVLMMELDVGDGSCIGKPHVLGTKGIDMLAFF